MSQRMVRQLDQIIAYGRWLALLGVLLVTFVSLPLGPDSPAWTILIITAIVAVLDAAPAVMLHLKFYPEYAALAFSAVDTAFSLSMLYLGGSPMCWFQFLGDGESKKLKQSITRTGKMGDTYALGALAAGSSLPAGATPKVILQIKYADPPKDKLVLTFDEATYGPSFPFMYLSGTLIATRDDYISLVVQIKYSGASGTFMVDSVRLVQITP